MYYSRFNSASGVWFAALWFTFFSLSLRRRIRNSLLSLGVDNSIQLWSCPNTVWILCHDSSKGSEPSGHSAEFHFVSLNRWHIIWIYEQEVAITLDVLLRLVTQMVEDKLYKDSVAWHFNEVFRSQHSASTVKDKSFHITPCFTGRFGF